MTDETTEAGPQEPSGEPSAEDTQAEAGTESAASDEHDEHSLKEGLREGAAKAWGLAVEVGSLLSGQSGDIVEAEREVAKAEAEEFIDRIDGEG
jgi:hypothetical protein